MTFRIYYSKLILELKVLKRSVSMDLQTIYLIVSLGFDVLVTLIVLFKGKGKDTTTIEQLAEKAQAKADKYFAKQCKKHKLQIEATGGADETTTNET